MNLKRILRGSLALITITSCSCTSTYTGLSERPNIIYILSDDLGYGDLGSFGQEKIKTPHLDKLAEEGMRFTQHYSGSSVCAPSRCVLMTGLHTGNAWIRANKGGDQAMGQFPLADSILTVAEILKEAGYATGAIGKWGLGGPGSEGAPTRQGFNFFFGYKCQSHAHNFYPEFIFLNSDTFRLRNEMPPPVAANQTGYATVRLDYTPDLFAERSIQFVNEHKNSPFFLYLALTPPHVNNEAPLGMGMEVPDQGEYASKSWPRVEIDKAAMISRMDSDIGRLIHTLKELGIDKNTLVIFTSDNGPHKERGVNPEFFNSSGPLRGVKRDLYEGGIRVPMIAWWPGVIGAGTESKHISAFWDFLPTACELAGVKIPEWTDGISFVNELTGKPQQNHKYLYWEYPVNNGKLAVRYGNWKAVKPNLLTNPDLIELYNLENDLAEENNVASENPEIIEVISQFIEEAHTPSPHFPM